MNSCVKFEYQYRDADNYKNCREMLFLNPNNIPVDAIEREIRANSIENTWFIAHQVHVPELFIFAAGQPTQADHCLHEILSLEIGYYSGELKFALDPIENLVARFREAKLNGWNLFDPITEGWTKN